MSQQFNTILNHRYEVRSAEPCTVLDSSGIHLCTAIPGCVGEFWGNGKSVTLSSATAEMREIPIRRESQPWQMVSLSGASSDVSLCHKTIYRGGELHTLSLSIESVEDDLFCEICFTSGSTPTALTVPEEWRWFGDHLSDGVFVPQPNNRYRLVVLSDGVFIRAAAEGVDL